jgi:hypothetical protein
MHRKSVILAVAILLLNFNNAFASDNIQTFSSDISDQELLAQSGDRLMLSKDWYGYEFEISPSNTAGPLKMQAVDDAEYVRALDEVQFPLETVGEYKIHFLTYKLKNNFSTLALSFKDGSTVVFGTYAALPLEELHRLAVHELGHEIDFSLMDNNKWREYKKLRGIGDETVYSNAAEVYVNRPQEIFAEDFRLLFGGEAAKTAAHLNSGLASPDQVPGLKEFFLSLADESI